MSAVTAATNTLAATPPPTSDRPGSPWTGPTVQYGPDRDDDGRPAAPKPCRNRRCGNRSHDFPLIAADLAYVRGMAHRQLGEEDKAQIVLSKATLNGALIPAAQQALADPTLQLVVTDEETINSRTNRWDVSTERSSEEREEAENDDRRSELLAEGRALLDKQVGLAEVSAPSPNSRIRSRCGRCDWQFGLPVNNQTNHMLLVGPPGTGKTTTAEALGKIYGAGHVRHPEIIEVKRADFLASTSARPGRKPMS